MNTPKRTVFTLHVAISATLLLVLMSVMMLWWYPKGLFGIAGGWDGLKILLPIDMVLGPALTFLFYKPGKKSAVFDLTAIACVQLAALSYGVFAVYSQHPQALVLAEGELAVLTPTDFREARQKLEEDKQQVHNPKDLDSNLPPVVVAKPYTREQYGSYLESILNGGLELPHRAERYQDLATGGETLHGAKLKDEALTAALGDKVDPELDYYRLRSMHGAGVAAFKKDSTELVRVLPRQPRPKAAALSQSD